MAFHVFAVIPSASSWTLPLNAASGQGLCLGATGKPSAAKVAGVLGVVRFLATLHSCAASSSTLTPACFRMPRSVPG
jgi:hypothetical protein